MNDVIAAEVQCDCSSSATNDAVIAVEMQCDCSSSATNDAVIAVEMRCDCSCGAMSDADDQTDELLALASIYDNSAFTSQTDGEKLSAGTLKAAVELSQPLLVTIAGKGKQLDN